MTLTNALRQLDPKVDSDWTTQGKPVIDRVKELADDENVTRADVDAVASDLTRSTASEYRWAPEIVIPEETPEVKPGATTPEIVSEVDRLRVQFDGIEVKYNEKHAESDKCRVECDELKSQMEALDAKITSLEPDSFAASNRRYLDRMHSERMKRADQGDPRSALDKALQNVSKRPGQPS